MRKLSTALVIAGLVVLLVAGAAVLFGRDDTKTVHAEFERTVGLFVGSDVRIMGMRVGEVTKITPHPSGVDVEMVYDARYRLPRDVKAVVVAPSVIADRFVQFTPAWTGGPTLASDGRIARADTRVPVELDRSIQVTTDLMRALGPEDTTGALGTSIKALAEVMEGNGADTREALRQLADATDVLAGGSDDFAGTVGHLSGLTGKLADYDKSVRTFNDRLGSVADTLNDQSGQLSALLRELADSLGQVAEFVAANRQALSTDVRRLAAVTGALVKEREALTEIADIAPLAFTDLVETYDPAAKAVRTRANFTEIVRAVDVAVCAALTKSQGDAAQPICDALADLVDAVGLRGGLPLP